MSRKGTIETTPADSLTQVIIIEDVAPTNCKVIIMKNSLPEVLQICSQCRIKRKVFYLLKNDATTTYICHEHCLENFKIENENSQFDWLSELNPRESSLEISLSYTLCCYTCKKVIHFNYKITWQGMEFCNEICLLESQLKFGSHCLQCCRLVPLEVLGQLCRLWGNDIRQFCSVVCQTEHEKNLEMCSNCLQDASRHSTVIYDQGKPFCSIKCQENYALIKKGTFVENSDGNRCITCDNIPVYIAKYNSFGFCTRYVCSDECFNQFCVKWSLDATRCFFCKQFTSSAVLKQYKVFDKNVFYIFCSSICRKRFLNEEQRSVSCKNCDSEKNIFEIVIKYTNSVVFEVCNLDCLGLYRVVKEHTFVQCSRCYCVVVEMFQVFVPNGIVHSFCSLLCLYNFMYNGKKIDETKMHHYVANLFASNASVKDVNINCVEVPTVVHSTQWLEEEENNSAILTTQKSTPHKKESSKIMRIKKNLKEAQTKASKIPKAKASIHIKRIISKMNDAHVERVINTINQDSKALIQLGDTSGKKIESLFGIKIWTLWAKLVVGLTQPNILKLTPKNRRNSLATFIRYLNKQNKDSKYSSDTIYYICLSIQKFLQENSCEDALFLHGKYSNFGRFFDFVAEKFQKPSNFDSFKVEENHLWETMQLGNHSPQALLFTLMYMFAKYCHSMTKWKNHERLSPKQLAGEFSEIYCPPVVTVKMRDFPEGCVEKIQFILLRNDINRAKCPIRLCQFYLEKCPAAIKFYDQFFYLEPHKKFNFDDAVWFTTTSLSLKTVRRNLNLIKMVKEINN